MLFREAWGMKALRLERGETGWLTRPGLCIFMGQKAECGTEDGDERLEKRRSYMPGRRRTLRAAVGP